MNRYFVTSSHIRWVEYDPIQRLARIGFKREFAGMERPDDAYEYWPVPAEAIADLLFGASPGRAFNDHIRANPKINRRKLEAEPVPEITEDDVLANAIDDGQMSTPEFLRLAKERDRFNRLVGD